MYHYPKAYLDIVALVEEQILRLQIAMAYVVRVAEVERRDNLAKELTRLFRHKAALAHQIVEELAAGDVLQQQVSSIERR